MTLFYVLINGDTDSDIGKEITKMFKNTEYEYSEVFGVYDLILKIKYENVRELADKVRTMPKVRSVMILTCES